MLITNKEYPELKSVFTIKNPKYKQGKLLSYGPLWGSVKWYETFDYVHFFNTGEIRANRLIR